MKTCTKCGVEKSLDAFAVSRDGRDGRRNVCKDCMNRAGLAQRTGWRGPVGRVRGVKL